MFGQYGVLYFKYVTTAYTIHDNAATSGMFNKENIINLLEIFQQATIGREISSSLLQKAKSLYFYQFILAGAFRSFIKGNFGDAKRILQLFKINEIKKLSPPVKWLPVYLVLQLILFPFKPLKLGLPN
ncbi:hypothetical protein [Xanthovirga aplysinae]|uniref:hypothetical protein n=1 Tax=Xanthovirga aplysinae TaxID=2529853 RepID=UPI0012BC0A73|nr:hypothetical protein [Xanthovirga aplysinae]MTI30627.1 hypothetical protein [Xanthovirga aplysinae]